MVYIHGGNFLRGSASEYEPDYLLDEDIVLVVIQYRLGMFGFLSTEDEHAGGNYGMFDQVTSFWLDLTKSGVHGKLKLKSTKPCFIFFKRFSLKS